MLPTGMFVRRCIPSPKSLRQRWGVVKAPVAQWIERQKALGSTPTWRVQFSASFFKDGLPVTSCSKIIQYIAEFFFYYLVLLKNYINIL
jgi:hypothetical protein